MDSVGVEFSVDADQIGHLIFDRPNEAHNILGSQVMRRLEQLLEEIEKNKNLVGVIVQSGKRDSFIVGADVEEIARLESLPDAEEKAAYGQAIFERISQLRIPVVAAIQGTCLGGGTELALACHRIVIGNHPRCEIGLPEVRLGLLPGWGGTQRLPRRIPLPVALDMILTGRSKRGKSAAAVGLADQAVPPEYVLREARAWILGRGRPTAWRTPHPSGRGWIGAAARLLPPVRLAFFSIIRKQTARKIRMEDYPAPFKALEAIEYGLGRPLSEGLAREAQLLAQVALTQTRKNLTNIFFMQRDAKKMAGKGESNVAPLPIRRVGLLGAGVMGGGIAQLCAENGLPVRMKDLDLKPLGQGLRHARQVFDRRARRRKQSAGQVEGMMARISPTLTYDGFGGLPMVIEAVVENLEVKKKVLSDVEELTRGRCLFASNTSSLPIDQIAEGCAYPGNVLGMHFFNPVDRMPLVEVIRGTATRDEAVVTVVELCRRLKKTPVVVNDGPGFLVNRILMAYLNEALSLLKEGIAIETADKYMLRFGMPMGPFELLDQVGIDVAHKVADILAQAFSDRVRPSRILEAAHKENRLGKKNGRGFYRWDKGKKRGPDPTVYALVRDRGGRRAPEGEVVDRLVLPMINEAALCLVEGIARTPADVDLAMVMGTGFPPFRGGLLRYADTLGLAEVVRRQEHLSSLHDPRFRPVPLVRELARSGRTFLPA